jgi:hypothetical protein
MSDTSAPHEVKHSIKYTKGTQISSLWLLTARILVLKLNWFVMEGNEHPTYGYL